MNVNRDAPYRMVDSLRLWWVIDGKFQPITRHFDLGILPKD